MKPPPFSIPVLPCTHMHRPDACKNTHQTVMQALLFVVISSHGSGVVVATGNEQLPSCYGKAFVIQQEQDRRIQAHRPIPAIPDLTLNCLSEADRANWIHLQSTKPHPSSRHRRNEALTQLKASQLIDPGVILLSQIYFYTVCFSQMRHDDDDVYALSPACSLTAQRKHGGSVLAATHNSQGGFG